MRDDSSTVVLQSHPRRDELARLVAGALLAAADERRLRFGDGLDELLTETGLDAGDGVVGEVDVVAALRASEPPETGRELFAPLLIRGIALEQPSEAEAERIAQGLAWLAAHSFVDALWLLPSELDAPTALSLHEGLAKVIRDADERGAPRGRGEALAAAQTLRDQASEIALALAGQIRDPTLAAALRSAADEPTVPRSSSASLPSRPSVSFSGRVVAAPSESVALVLWCLSGLIVVRYLLRAIAFVLGRRRPAEVSVDDQGVTVKYEESLLGQRLAKREIVIPRDNLARAMREVRYPRLSLYAGLLALSLGTFVGASFAVDGGRVGSPSLIAIGAVICGVGVALDLVLGVFLAGANGKHQLVFQPRRGRKIAIRTDDAGAADRALARLRG